LCVKYQLKHSFQYETVTKRQSRPHLWRRSAPHLSPWEQGASGNFP